MMGADYTHYKISRHGCGGLLVYLVYFQMSTSLLCVQAFVVWNSNNSDYISEKQDGASTVLPDNDSVVH